MRTAALAALVVLIECAASADRVPVESVFNHPKNPADLRELTSTANGSLANAQVVHGEFIQRRYVRDLPRPLESQGTFLYARGIGIEWCTVKPLNSCMVITGAGITRRNDDVPPAAAGTVSQPAQQTVARIFFSLFALDFDALARDFSLFGEQANGQWRVGLKARRAALGRVFQDAVLAGSTAADTIVLHDAGGDRTEITLQNPIFSSKPLPAGDRARF